jgi:polar amino acid transport system substrate-binding protein/glutamate/aspartate transport system substrate-binding protein
MLNASWSRRACTALFVLACTGAQVPAAMAQTLERIAADKALRIGFIADQAPFSARSATDAPAGYAIDLCNTVAREVRRRIEGLAVTYSEVGIADGFQAIADGRIDLLCGAVTATLQRREMVDFSQPFFISGTSALIREYAPRVLRDLVYGDRPLHTTRSIELTPFETIRVGVHGGTRTEALLAEAIAKGGYRATVAAFPTHADGIAALEAGSIDAYFADRGLLVAMLEKARGPRLELGTRIFSREPYAIALRRGDSEFRLLVDRTLSAFVRSPDLGSTLSRYFGEQAATVAAQLRDLSLPE